MGALIPIGGGADAEIKGLLNTAFNNTNLPILRTIVAGENIFNENTHHLHRIAYRLGVYPVKTYTGDNAKGKWFFFLKNVLKAPAVKSIMSIFSFAITHTTVKRIVFDAVQDTSAAEHHIAPNNPDTPQTIAPLVDTTGTLTVLLVCPAPLTNQASPTPNQSGDLDRDAQGNIIERPPIKIFTPQNLSPPTLSRKTRQPKGKSKATKKVKKAKTKKRK